MPIQNSLLKNARRGMTLVELLIVCFIIVLFVAVAAPLLRPNTADTKIREAARQLNAYFAEAKAMAAQRAKNVALVFDRAANEGARDPNIVTRLYLAEAPPTYAGDTVGATVAVWVEPFSQPGPSQPVVPGLTTPATNGVPPILLTLDFAPGNPMVDVITLSYFPNPPTPGNAVPFTIRLGNPGSPSTSGPWYQGLAIYSPTGSAPGITGKPIQYFIMTQVNQPWHKLASAGAVPVIPSPYPGMGPQQRAVFQMNFPPQNSSASNLELPTGSCIDLHFSGYQFYNYDPSVSAAQVQPPAASFYLPEGSSASPLYIVFGPGGDVQYIIGDANGLNHQPTRMNFLIGTTERAIEFEGANDATLRQGNLNDRNCQWVTVNARTGYISTADNAGFDTEPPDPTTMGAIPPAAYRGTAIGRARAMAASLNTKGGR
jgi:type II secretory pathway pseudopilin PulG